MHKTCADGGPRPPKPKPSVVPFDYRPVIRGRGTNEKVDLTQLILEWEQKLADVDAPAAVCGWCKEDMVIKRNTKVYCSARCRVAHKRWMDKQPR